MFRNYLKVAFRSLQNQLSYSLINVTGLAIGIACCVLMLLYVQDELTFDRFHQKSERIYRLVETRSTPAGGRESMGYTIGQAGPAMVETFPEIVQSVRLRDRIGVGRFVLRSEENRFLEANYLITEPSFLEIFDFELLRGNARTALAEPNSVILTPPAALKYFGDADPVNQSLSSERWGDLRVTGVMARPPRKSHLDFDMLISFATLEAVPAWKEFIDSWAATGFGVYVLADRALDLDKFNAALPEFVSKHRPDMELVRNVALQPLDDIHFKSGHIQSEHNAREGVPAYSYIFSAIALFVLLIACINYMNLATARFTKRAQEIGMRKVVGAQRRQVAGQILSESLISTFVSLIIAVALVQLALPAFNQLASKELTLQLSSNWPIVASLVGLVLLVGLISGSYPAVYLSGLRPAVVFKGSHGWTQHGVLLRRMLVIVQFSLSVIMIISTLVAYRQLSFIRSKNLGFNEKQVVVVDINSQSARDVFQAIKTEMARIATVERVSVSSRVPGEWKNITEIDVVSDDRQQAARSMYFFAIDEDFVDTFGIELVAGRNISGVMGTDTAAVIINQAAAAALGLDDPLGRQIEAATLGDRGSYQARVIGVVEDFHFQSLHETIEPLVMGHWKNPVREIDYFSCRINPVDLSQTIADLQAVHEQFDKVTPFEYNFLDERLRDFYETDRQVGQIFGVTAFLAVSIACLGLFGLSAFTTEQRTKEIGVRKVLGASVSGLAGLLSKDFLRLVLLANIFAWPVAWYAMNGWLQAFAYHVDLSWWVFASAGGIALLIAVLTVSSQAIKAALSNPVESLRYE